MSEFIYGPGRYPDDPRDAERPYYLRNPKDHMHRFASAGLVVTMTLAEAEHFIKESQNTWEIVPADGWTVERLSRKYFSLYASPDKSEEKT